VSRDPQAKLSQALQKRSSEGNLRSLTVHEQGIDFYSNDYLGLSRSKDLDQRIRQLREQHHGMPRGSTGSRLISGNSSLAEELEQELADFHGAEAGLLFSSGYAANSGLIAAVAGIGDCLILDELIHASSVDGARLSKADKLIFRHNDLDDLSEKLRTARSGSAGGSVFVVVESLYSMDGDFAPLDQLLSLCTEFGAGLIVDEAHTNGITGKQGRGSLASLPHFDSVFARIHTFGKGLGLHGAVVLGSGSLREYLINFCRPFIFSTAPSHDSLLAIQGAYSLLPELDQEREHLFSLVRRFRELIPGSSHHWLNSSSWIQSLLIPGNQAVVAATNQLQEQGFLLKAIRAPSVPAGTERVRICLHASNTVREIETLFEALEEPQCVDISLRA
jgi:8-amino-7-oxononanoate synthase